ncbi:hypothetical protein BDF20DRAFT_855904 [Mycotypha africana]|uniref:uncharacterized protein n=1 Tax=Mycotypha africana TaxID=64632 RepID=UPI0023003323|nr:uncharacterized protein BDF20DRAFT_855904 [Mycotypha africana]KAI8988483.1 hypothetical protein BDF20DRAFT_855904 [Mycotypha africana]
MRHMQPISSFFFCQFTMSVEQEFIKAKSALASAVERNNIQTCLDILDTLSKHKVTGELLKVSQKV